MSECFPGEISIIDALNDAMENKWSGMVQVRSQGEQVGVVVTKEGGVAWAVCKYQREDLGTFLLRRGHVTAEQLREVRDRYEALGKTRKLVALLEEAGIADRETLRKCLLKHMKRALACMLALPSCSVVTVDGVLAADEELVFRLDEVLPDFREDEDPALTLGRDAYQDSVTDLSVHAGILSGLSDIPSYRGSIVAAADGRLFAGHGFDGAAAAHPLDVGVSGAMLQGSSRHAEQLGMGRLVQTVLECEDGALILRWLDFSQRVYLAVFLGEGARTGIARHRIATTADALAHNISTMFTQKRGAMS